MAMEMGKISSAEARPPACVYGCDWACISGEALPNVLDRPAMFAPSCLCQSEGSKTIPITNQIRIKSL